MVSTIDQRFWAGFSGNFYLPSTVAPLDQSPEGLPVGVQIITREYGDYTIPALCRIAGTGMAQLHGTTRVLATSPPAP